MQGKPGVSTVGKVDAKPVNQPSNQDVGKGHDAAWYRQQIESLQQKIPPLDDKILKLKAALSGKSVDSVRTWGGVRPDDWRDQLARLEKQKEDLLVFRRTLSRRKPALGPYDSCTGNLFAKVNCSAIIT